MAPVGLAVDWIYMDQVGLALGQISDSCFLALNWIYLTPVGLTVELDLLDSSWFTCGTGST